MFGLDDLFGVIGIWKALRQVKEVGKMAVQLLEGQPSTSANSGTNYARKKSSAGNTRKGKHGGKLSVQPNGFQKSSPLEYAVDEAGAEAAEAESAAKVELNGTIAAKRKKLLDVLLNDGYTEPLYYAQLSRKVSTGVNTAPVAAADSELLAKLNSEDLPREFQVMDAGLSRLVQLEREAEDYTKPPKKPDVSKANFLRDWRQIVSAYAHYLAAQSRRSMKGRKRTHETVLEEMVTTIEGAQTHVEVALSHSERITDGLTEYEETVIEARLKAAGDEWSGAFKASRSAQDLLNLIAQFREGSTPSQYSAFSIAWRNLARLQQHSAAKMSKAEAVAMQNEEALGAANSLEMNIRVGMLQLEKYSALIAQTIKDVRYTTQGTLLLKDGYKSVEALAESAITLRNIMALRVKQISDAGRVFNDKLRTAQENIIAKEREDRAIAEQPKISAGVDYEQQHTEALRLFAQRGLEDAKKLLYREAVSP